MSEPLTVVQLSRFGDIINIIPAVRHAAGGRRVRWIVHERFTDALHDCQHWCDVVKWQGTDQDVVGATEWVRSEFRVDPLVTQVNGNPVAPAHAYDNFIAEQWSRAGALDLFHDLPLEDCIAQRDGSVEAAQRVLPHTDKPILAYCLNGHSSPFKQAPAFAKWLLATANELGYEPLDVGALLMPRITDLIEVLKRCRMLVTIDTAVLHVAAAAGVPTISLHRDMRYGISEARLHVIGRFLYGEALQDVARQEIRMLLTHPEPSTEFGRFSRHPDAMLARPIVHVCDWYTSKDHITNQRHAAAKDTWTLSAKLDRNWTTVLHQLHPGQRSSHELGDTRYLPYVRDVIDFGAARCKSDNDILIFTNADTCLTPEAAAHVRKRMDRYDGCHSARIDIGGTRYPLTLDDLRGQAYVGTDLFAFTAGWWRAARSNFPDMLLACEGWDFVLRKMLDRDFGDETTGSAALIPPVVYHERHRPFWADRDNLQTNPGQIHNRAVGRAWATENGFSKYLHAGDYLFKSEADVKDA